MFFNSLKFRSLAIFGMAVAASFAAAQWRTISPPPGDTFIYPRAISRNDNVVVGFSQGPVFGLHPMKWTPSAGTEVLPVPAGYVGANCLCVNADGSVIGGGAEYQLSPNNYTDVPVKWTSSGVEILPSIDPNFPAGDPFFSSADGSVLYGSTWPSNFAFSACKWDAFGLTIDPFVPAGGQYSGVSDDGSVRVGAYLVSFNEYRAFEVTSSGFQQLPSLSAIHPFSVALGVSGDGTVILGYAMDDAGIYTPVKWTSAGIQEIPGIGPKVYGGVAYYANADGSVIIYNSEGQTTVWTPNGVQTYRDYLIAQGVQGLEDVPAIYAGNTSPDGTAFTGQLLGDDGYEFYYIRLGEHHAPPVANAGPDQSHAAGSFFVDGSASYDPEGQPLKYKWYEGTNLLGTGPTLGIYLSSGHHVITLKVMSSLHLKGTDDVNLDVADDTPPTISLNGDATMYVNYGGIFSDPGATAHDDQDGNLPVNISGSVNTSAVGAYSLTYSATDSGNHTVYAYRTVYVVYTWSGFLQPINSDGSSIFKLGSTVPVKFTLTGAASGLSITAHLYVAKVSESVVGTEIEAVSTSAADSGNTFRYSGGNYTFNLATKSLSAGTWQLRVDLGDGVLHTVLISLKS